MKNTSQDSLRPKTFNASTLSFRNRLYYTIILLKQKGNGLNQSIIRLKYLGLYPGNNSG